MSQSLTVAAHAKANLFLRVLAQETTGFHTLETLFTLLELADELTVTRTTEGMELRVEGADTGPEQENLVWRAATMVLEATGATFGVRAVLRKRIPVGAGLGGGSSDAAAALYAVNALCGGAIPRHEILQCAARLGSDVPFFASGAPMALAWGRGERLLRLAPPPSAPALLAVAPFGISTAKAYEALHIRERRDPQRGSVVLEGSAFQGWGSIGRLGGNDFESVVFGQEPALKLLFERMAETRPLLVRMSGSGCAILAIYKDERERDAAALAMGEKHARLIKTATRAVPAGPPTA